MDDDAQMVAIDKDQLARMRGEYGPEKDGCGDLDFDTGSTTAGSRCCGAG